MNEAKPGARLAGRYRLDEQLRSSADESVWSAVDSTLDRQVTVWILRPGHPFADDVLDAARRVALIDDRRLIKVLDVGTDSGTRGDRAYVVNEQVEGETLDVLVARKPLGAAAARRVAGETAEGLAAAATRGLHHLKLTPELVTLTSKGLVKIAGLAVQAASIGLDPGHATRANRIDATAVVGLLYAGLTGRSPLPDSGLPQAPRNAAGDPVPPAELVPGVPVELDELCTRTFGTHGRRVPGGAAGGPTGGTTGEAPMKPADIALALDPWVGAAEADLPPTARPGAARASGSTRSGAARPAATRPAAARPTATRPTAAEPAATAPTAAEPAATAPTTAEPAATGPAAARAAAPAKPMPAKPMPAAEPGASSSAGPASTSAVTSTPGQPQGQPGQGQPGQGQPGQGQPAKPELEQGVRFMSEPFRPEPARRNSPRPAAFSSDPTPDPLPASVPPTPDPDAPVSKLRPGRPVDRSADARFRPSPPAMPPPMNASGVPRGTGSQSIRPSLGKNPLPPARPDSEIEVTRIPERPAGRPNTGRTNTDRPAAGHPPAGRPGQSMFEPDVPFGRMRPGSQNPGSQNPASQSPSQANPSQANPSQANPSQANPSQPGPDRPTGSSRLGPIQPATPRKPLPSRPPQGPNQPGKPAAPSSPNGATGSGTDPNRTDPNRTDPNRTDPNRTDPGQRPNVQRTNGHNPVRSTGEQLMPWASTWSPSTETPSALESTGPFPLILPQEAPPARQSRQVLLAVVGVLAVVVVLAALSLRGMLGDGIGISPGPASATGPALPGDSPTPSSTAPSAKAPVAPQIAAIRAIDPQGDGDENTSDSPLAVDGDSATSWSSQTYKSSTFGGLKKGVGLAIRLKQRSVVSRVTVNLTGVGGRVQLRLGPSSDPTQATVVASVANNDGSTITLEPRRTLQARYVILWFTELPKTDKGYKAEVVEVRVT